MKSLRSIIALVGLSMFGLTCLLASNASTPAIGQATSPMLSAVALTANPASPQPVNTPITLQANAMGGTSIQYQFWLYNPNANPAWRQLQSYSSSAACAWTPMAPGNYLISVTAMDGVTGLEVNTTCWDAISGFPLTAVTVSASPAPPWRLNAPITLTASATGGSNVLYQFWLYNPAAIPAWSQLQSYSSSSTCTWTPASTGNYLLSATAQDGITGAVVNTTCWYTITAASPLSAVAVSAAPASPQPFNTPIMLTGTATGGSGVQYQFWLYNAAATPAWRQLQAYSASANCRWTPSLPGDYLLSVSAQDGVTGTEVVQTLWYAINANAHTNSIDGAAMVWVPGGSFTMGSPYGNINAPGDGSPTTQQVTLSGYWIYTNEVTVAQYRTFCAATGYALPVWPGNQDSWVGKSGWSDLAVQQMPIVNVDWYDAKAYCSWAGVSLPTEAQYEYAARGPQENNYPWGGNASMADPGDGWDATVCATYYNSIAQNISTWPVGSFPQGASWCGAEDMAGNVWEWCADLYGDYSSTPVTDPIGPAKDISGYGYHVLRGGSWYYGTAKDECRGAYRYSYNPHYGNTFFGFRCVLPSAITLALSMTVLPVSPQPCNLPITVTATATGGMNVRYQFWLYNVAFSPVWRQLQAYSSSATCLWTPNSPGNYLISVTAQDGMAGKVVNQTLWYTIFLAAPTITTFTPSSGTAGATVTITGANFTGTSAVAFGGTIAASFTVINATTISATVGSGATGTITVTTPGGTATSASNFTVNNRNGTPDTNPTDGAAMVWVPGGSFTMGSSKTDDGGVASNGETQQVTLSGYWIYKYQVTAAQYRAFCSATGHALPPWPGNLFSWAGTSGWSDPAMQQMPIVNVTWTDAAAYCRWAGVSLPTEAQYEYAARGPEENNYPWGGTATAVDPNDGWDLLVCANYFNSYEQSISTWPVGSFPAGASWCGAQDLAGNVWGWCADWYGDYSSTPVTNPTGPATGSARVVRGGSWGNNNANFFRAALRISNDPTNQSSAIGFRCVAASPGL